MLKFALCDDDNATRTKYIAILENIFTKYDINAKILFDTDDPKLFLDFVHSNQVDIVFLDIDLKNAINGLEIARKIREKSKSVYIVFITGHLEYALIAYKFTTFDYLIKPVTPLKLEECVIRLKNHIEFVDIQQTHIKIKSGAATHMVNKNDILYVEKANHKSMIYTSNEIIETSCNLEEMQKLSPDVFFRCHKSYLINKNKITKFDSVNNYLLLDDTIKCPVGRKYAKDLKEIIKNG